MGRDYNLVALDELSAVRAAIRADLKSKSDNKKYRLRTFYLGPRRSRRSMCTLKADARAAKIAIYEVRRVADVFPDFSYLFNGPECLLRVKYF